MSQYVDDGGIDKLFNNDTAKAYYEALNGTRCSSTTEISIMNVAHADAWFTTMLAKLVDPTLLEKKGGTHNKSFNTSFRARLPHATEGVMSTVRSTFLSSSQDVMSAPDGYGSEARWGAAAFLCPKTSYEYLAVGSSFFASHVCSWIGAVHDAYIGRCPPSPEAIRYEHIRANDVLRKVQLTHVD